MDANFMKKIFKKNGLRLSFLGGLLLISTNVMASQNNPFSVKDYGNFSRMLTVKSAPGNVSLQPMQGLQHLYGLGALQSLQGEITIIDGNVLISSGTANDGHTMPVTSQDYATILVTAPVKSWIPVPIPTDLTQTSFEEFVVKARSKYGISTDVPFPFLVKGEIRNLHWHVVNGLNFSAKEMGSPHAHKKKFEAAETHGILIGFYSGKQLEGVISHPGERFHLHFADINLTHAGHVDDYTIGANATLFLPKN